MASEGKAGVRRQVERGVETGLHEALRLLMWIFVVLLIGDSVANLAVNLIHGTEYVRPRLHWQGILARNAILGVFPLLMYLVLRFQFSGKQAARDSRIATLGQKAVRGLAWLALAWGALVVIVNLVESLIFHQSFSLAGTRGSTDRLVYAAVFGATALVVLYRTRAVPSLPSPIQTQLNRLRSYIFGLIWQTCKGGMACGLLLGAAFSVSDLILYRTAIAGRETFGFFRIVPFPVFVGIQVAAGFFCGYSIGVILALRGRLQELAAVIYSLAEPLVNALIDQAPVTARLDSYEQALARAAQPVIESSSSRLAAFARRRVWKTLRGRMFGDVWVELAQEAKTGRSREALQTMLRQKVIEAMASDVRTRFTILLFVHYAVAGVAWSSVFLATLLFW